MADKRIPGNASARAGASQRAIPQNTEIPQSGRAFGIGDAMGGLAGLAGSALGMATQNWSNNKQYHQQKRLQNLQMAGNKEMADYMQELGIKTWEETGYDAQRRQMQGAGLNVGLMYGQAGAGGTTQTPGSPGVQGGQAQSQPQNIGMGIEMAMQLSLMKAQKENIEADTANKKAGAGSLDADVPLKGAQTTNVGADTAKKEQETRNLKITENILKHDEVFAQTRANVASMTIWDAINAVKANAQKLANEANLAEVNWWVADQTRDEQVLKFKKSIDYQNAQTALAWANTNLAKSGVKLQESQMKLIAEQVAQLPVQLTHEERRVRTQEIIAKFTAGEGATTARNIDNAKKVANIVTDFIEAIVPGN